MDQFFILTIINVNSYMWLVATILGSAAPSKGVNMPLTTYVQIYTWDHECVSVWACTYEGT